MFTVEQIKKIAENKGKPYQGKFDNWVLREIPLLGGYTQRWLVGYFVDHPRLGGSSGHTSTLLHMDSHDGWCETLNSVYSLGSKRDGW